MLSFITIFILIQRIVAGAPAQISLSTSSIQPNEFQLGVFAWSWYVEDPTRAARLLDKLPSLFRYVRWSPVLYADSAPIGATDAEMDEFVSSNVLDDGGLAQLAETSRTLEQSRRSIKQLIMFWQPPSSYRVTYDGVTYFNTTCVADYAMFVVACVRRLRSGNVSVPLLELMNEPDGYWSSVTNTAPSTFNELVVAVRNTLDAHGLNETILTGPSLSTLRQYPSDAYGNFAYDNVGRYLTALSADGRSALGALSFHSYDRIYNQQKGVDFVDESLRLFGTEVLDVFDPTRKRLRIMAEFSVEDQYIDVNNSSAGTFTATHFAHNAMDATCYADTDLATAPFADAEQYQPAYAVQSLAYVLLHLNHGYDAAIMWELADRSGAFGDNKCFGLFDRNDGEKPVLAALRTFLQFTDKDENPNQKYFPAEHTWTDVNGVVVGALIADDRSRMVVGIANTSPFHSSFLFDIAGFSILSQTASYHLNASFETSNPGQGNLAIRVNTTVPPFSSLSLLFE